MKVLVWFVNVFLSVFLCISVSFGAEENDCESLTAAESYGQAYPICQKQANQGDANALFLLGSLFEDGSGVVQNNKMAVYWFKESALQGNEEALSSLQNFAENGDDLSQFALGSIYAKGKVDGKDIKEAVHWVQKSAEQRNLEALQWLKSSNIADAQIALGDMFAVGQGVDKNNKKAIYWYKKAANQGDVNAQLRLGRLFESGAGKAKNHKMAVYWFKESALQGNEDALILLQNFAENGDDLSQFALGSIYAKGKVEGKDIKEAVHWVQKAAEQRNLEALQWLKSLNIADAQIALGYMFAVGQGVAQDNVKAVQWFKKAAEKRDNKDAKQALILLDIPYFNQQANVNFDACAGVADTFLKKDKWSSAVDRISACQYNNLDPSSFEDVMLFLNRSIKLSGKMLFSLNWITNQRFEDDTTVGAAFRQKYIANASDRSKKEAWLFPDTINADALFIGGTPALLALAAKGWQGKKFELDHPVPTLDSNFVSKKMSEMNEIKKLCKLQKNMVTEWNKKVSPGQVKYLMRYDNIVDAHIRDLKKKYEHFLSADVVTPILLRTKQLIYIADKESYFGYDDARLTEAAKVLARLDKHMIMTSNSESKGLFFKVYSSFKSAAGDAQMEMLKAIQDLSTSDQEYGGADKWWQN